MFSILGCLYNVTQAYLLYARMLSCFSEYCVILCARTDYVFYVIC